MNMHAQATPTDALDRARPLRALVNEIGIEALTFAPHAKIDATMRGWLNRASLDPDDPRTALVLADALAFAIDLSMTQPSASGSTAIDRLLRHRRPAPREKAAVAALQQMRFRLLRIRAAEAGGVFLVEDIATGESLHLFEDRIPVSAVGQVIATRLCPVAGTDGHVTFGSTLPLDDSGLRVATSFIRSGGKGLTNPHRCAEAIYRHVLRHGGAEIAGINRPPEGFDGKPEFPYGPDDSELDALAFAWAELPAGTEPSPDRLLAARRLANLDDLIEAVSTSAFARECGRDALAEAYARIAIVQMETLQRRASSGFGGRTPSLDTVAAEIERFIARDELPPLVRSLFDDLRRRVRVAPAGSHHDTKLVSLIQRIQALRAKTVEQGCTEQEALAAAEKVAEFLDRYGLSLSELDLRQQACEGVGVETDRRRTGPIDDCVPAVAAFFDCRVWGEKTETGLLRYVFFGLPADVEAAHYLYDLIEVTFVTETERFKRENLYAELHTTERRSGTNSFQIGLAHGVVRKLDAMRREREVGMIRSSGRDLVPIKASVVDEELARLGIRFHTRERNSGRTVLSDAYHAGHEAGQRFEVRRGIEDGHRRRRPRR
jgi:hypothetical protein